MERERERERERDRHEGRELLTGWSPSPTIIRIQLRSGDIALLRLLDHCLTTASVIITRSRTLGSGPLRPERPAGGRSSRCVLRCSNCPPVGG